MAKNDYYVLAYKLLAYLYNCLKNGKEVDAEYITEGGKIFTYEQNHKKIAIDHRYWIYILEHLLKQGYIEGIYIDETNSGKEIDNLWDCMITPEGIGYLLDNGLIEKARRALKEIGEVIPFELAGILHE